MPPRKKGEAKDRASSAQKLKRARPLQAHPSAEEQELGHDKKKSSASGSKIAVCAACRRRPQGILWLETDAKGNAVGDRCQECSQTWCACFAYLSWSEFAELNRSEAP